MEFIPLQNFKNMLVSAATAGNVSMKFVDTSNTTRDVGRTSYSTVFPIYNADFSNTARTAPDQLYPYPYASSSDTIPTATYTVPNQVGSVSIISQKTTRGWAEQITITSESDVTVKNLVFVRGVYYSNSSTSNATLFALKLDTPIELNSSNNHTANLYFSAEF